VKRRRIVAAVVGLAVLVAVIALNEVVFRLVLDTDYLRWYLVNGFIISLVFGFVTLAWGDLLNKQRYLISAHPVEYAAASLTLLVFPLASLGAIFQTGRESWQASRRLEETSAELRKSMQELLQHVEVSEELRKQYLDIAGGPPDEEPPEPEDLPAGMPVVDLVLTLLFAAAFLAVVVAWLVVVVPIQYFVYLVTGAPAREACGSPARVFFKREGDELAFREALKDEELPKGAVESGFSSRPVSFTAAVTAAVLFVTSLLVG
jgi:hypothetical protein